VDNASKTRTDRQHRQMRLWLTLVDPARPGRSRDVLLTAPSGARLADVRDQLVGPGADLTALYAGSHRLEDGDLLGMPPLLDGAVLGVGQPLEDGAGTRRPALLRLEVTGGPDSGHSFPLAPGRYVLGRAVDAALRVDDPDLSRAHLCVEVSTAGTLVYDLGTTNGTLLSSVSGVSSDGNDGAHLIGVGATPTPWPTGAALRAGGSKFRLRVHGSPSAATVYDGMGHVLVNRQPRSFAPPSAVEIRGPAAPDTGTRVRLPLLPMLVPLLLALPMAWLQRAPAYLLFGLMSPAMMLASHVSDRRGGRRADRRRRQDWERESARAATDLGAAVERETAQRHAAAPDLALLAQTAGVPLATLWERRPEDEDFLFLRLGLGDRPALVRLRADDSSAEPPTLMDVPLGVRLPDVGVLGLAGERPDVRRLASALVAQVAAWHSPRDVGLVLLAADAEALDDWAWAARLPHARGGAAGAATRADLRLGLLDRPGQVGARLDELLRELDDRTAVAGRGGGQPWAGPSLVVLIAGARRLRPVPGLARVLDEGPAVGIYAICLDEHRNRLPVECRAVLQLPDPEAGPGTYPVLLGVHPAIGDVRLDGVSGPWAEQLGRALAPLRDATPDPGGLDVPDHARLVDLLEIDPADPAALAHRWQTGAGSTAAVVGATADGPYVVDLRRDGPHVLIGGTTGSGKSELVQTLIASLAVANSPQQLGFVLVDYKGGAAFQHCAELPHTLGLVTDLDPQLTERALASLRAELRRREQLLQAAGATDVDEYRPRRGHPRPAPARAGHRRVPDVGRGAAGVPGRHPAHRGARPLARRPPGAGHATAGRSVVGRHRGQREPPDRPSGPRPGRLGGRDRRPRRGPDRGRDAGSRVRPLGRPAARSLPDRPGRRRAQQRPGGPRRPHRDRRRPG
jgi:S-DNA-T family DNA segregation ATPase FtsK/SpoIIIE